MTPTRLAADPKALRSHGRQACHAGPICQPSELLSGCPFRFTTPMSEQGVQQSRGSVDVKQK